MDGDNGIEHPTLGERAYLAIRDRILSGQFHPGERLLYQKLVGLLGISQTPIKEAFTRLENEGFVITVTRRGTFVQEFSASEVEEVFQIREMLEGLAARLACRSLDAAKLERLKSVNARFIAAARRRDMRECTAEDYAFHERLIEMGGNGKLRRIMSQTNLHLLSIAQSSPNFFTIAGEYFEMHTRLIEAIERRDEELAERLVRAHIRYGCAQVLPFARQQAADRPAEGPGREEFSSEPGGQAVRNKK